MKKLILSSIAILLFVVGSFAQRGANHLEKLSATLALTTEQQSVIETKFESFQANLKHLRSQEGEWDAKKESMKTLKQDFRKEIVSVLTTEQLEKFETLESNGIEKRKAFEGRSKGKMKDGKGNRFAMYKKHKAKRENLKKELLPIALEQRAKLDKEISSKDRKTIVELRKAITAKKEAQRKVWESRKSEFKNGGKPAREDVIAMKEEYRQERKNFMESKEMALLKALIEKYDSDLEEYGNPILEARKKLMVEHRSTSKSKINGEVHYEGKDLENGRWRKGMKKGKRGHGKAMAKRGTFTDKRKARFLLLDPDLALSESRFEKPKSAVNKINVFPNPAINQNTISYNVKTSGKIDVQLWDEKGNLINTVFSGIQDAGDQQIQVSTGELLSGSYYYTIKDANGVVISKRFIKAK